MNLRLVRKTFTEESTIGDLYVNETWECFTLEDIVSPVKIAGKTAIPRGQYDVVINYSNRFKRQMPLLLAVPGFEGIRIHSGNTAADTSGCILVGQKIYKDSITESHLAYNSLFFKLEMANRIEKIWIDIEEHRELL